MTSDIEQILARGPVSSKALQQALGLSQARVSVLLKDLGRRVVRFREGRVIRYMLARNAFGGDDSLPLWVVEPHGNVVEIASIRPLAHGGFFVEPLPGMPRVLLGEDGSGVFDGLPYFLDDLRPEGFIGRQIASELAGRSDNFPSDPRLWQTGHVGRYLVSNGGDLPGNLKVGDNAYLQLRAEPRSYSVDEYPALAEQVMGGYYPGSSAGGEQPKFTVFSKERQAHVLVKFSPPGDSEIARRWRDILVTEHCAAEALHRFNIPAVETRIFELEGRVFLESERFDRSGLYGRLSMISLQAVDAEFVGFGAHWVRVMDALCDKNLLSFDHLLDAEALWIFGRLINNTDMHLGNLSLGVDGDVFRLLPAYDMGSMGFAPRGGEVLPFEFSVPEISLLNSSQEQFKLLCILARDFWEAVENHSLISDEFRAFIGSIDYFESG